MTIPTQRLLQKATLGQPVYKPQRIRPRLRIQSVQLYQPCNQLDNLILPETQLGVLHLLRDEVVDHASQSRNQDTDAGPAPES